MATYDMKDYFKKKELSDKILHIKESFEKPSFEVEDISEELEKNQSVFKTLPHSSGAKARAKIGASFVSSGRLVTSKPSSHAKELASSNNSDSNVFLSEVTPSDADNESPAKTTKDGRQSTLVSVSEADNPSTSWGKGQKRKKEQEDEIYKRNKSEEKKNAGFSLKDKVVYTTETFSVFPVHSLILCTSSPYFKSMILESGMQETVENVISITVEPGQGKYLELLINSFYDPEVISNLDVFELLELVKISDMFLCDKVITQCLHLLIEKISSFRHCDVISDYIAKFQSMVYAGSPNFEIWELLKETCIEFLVKHFSGLEVSFSKQCTFSNMNFHCLMMLLSSKKPFIYHENNLFQLISNWLSFDVERQSKENIEDLVNQICYKEMSTEYLTQCVRFEHCIFSKWRGWTKWLHQSLCYHAMQNIGKAIPGTSNCQCHVIDDNTLQTFILKYNLRNSSDNWELDLKSLLVGGCVLNPKLMISKANSTQYKVILSLEMENRSFMKCVEMFACQYDFAFAIFPSCKPYPFLFTEKANIIEYYGRPQLSNDKINRCEFTAATIGEGLYEDFKKFGLNVVLVFKQFDQEWPSYVPEEWKNGEIITPRCYITNII